MRLLACLLGAVACAPPADGAPASGAQPDVPVAEAPEVPRDDTREVTDEAPASAGAAAPQAATLTDRYALDGRRKARFDLPGRLDEISGLAFSPDGRLFAHDDERGRVHVIDVETGEVGKRFDLGEELVRQDFEGIAIVGERFFLVTSLGHLYEFREGADRENMPYRVTDTGVGARCEVEGLDYDEAYDELLVACKVATPDRGAIVIHLIPIDPERARPDPIVVAKSQLPAFGVGAEFEASGVAVDPSGTIVLVSGRSEKIIEVDRAGRVLAAFALSRNRHPQSEGVEFGPDGTLYISDEQNGRDARLTAYARVTEPQEPGR